MTSRVRSKTLQLLSWLLECLLWMFSLGTLLLGNQLLCCEEAKPHGEIKCRSINSVITGSRHVNEETIRWFCSQLFKSLLATESFPADDRDIVQQRRDILGVLCLNSWPTEITSTINCLLLYATRFGVVCYAAIVNLNTIQLMKRSDSHKHTGKRFRCPAD